jgi:hypothetical protein
MPLVLGQEIGESLLFRCRLPTHIGKQCDIQGGVDLVE